MRVPRWLALSVLVSLVGGCGSFAPGLSGVGSGDLSIQGIRKTPDQLRIEAAMGQACAEPLLGDNSLLLHVDGVDAFTALRNLILSATKSLWFETFIWQDDETGDQIARMLVDRAAQGVDVRVLIDSLGSEDTGAGGHDRAVQQTFVEHGIPFRYYNPGILKGANVHITHRKVYLADGDHAMTGGMNIGDDYAYDWHDLLVETEGPAARQMHQEFIHDWNTSGDGPAQNLTIPGPPQAPSFGDKDVRVTVTSPDEGKTEIQDSLDAAIDAASSDIKVFEVYFSDPTLIAHLEAAARRGVKVQLILPTINDSNTFRYLNRYWGGQMQDAGAEVRLYTQRYSHLKFVSVDGVLSALGSANADTRSYQENQELTLMCTDPTFTQSVDRQLFDADWAISRLPYPSDLEVPFYALPLLDLANLLSYYL